nr:MAG TPA: hypothetical protein [Caudoviricetes sp.]
MLKMKFFFVNNIDISILEIYNKHVKRFLI